MPFDIPRRASLLAPCLVLAAALAGCGSPSPAGTTPTVGPAGTAPASAPSSGGQAGGACALVTATDLGSLGVTGSGRPSTISRGTATVHGCTWGHPPAREFHLQFEQLDPVAATQVKESLGGRAAVVPGVGDGARGQFGSVLAAVNFFKGSTFVSMALFGTGTGSRKNAFIAVAKEVATRL